MNTNKNTNKVSSSYFIPREATRSAHLLKRIRMLPSYSFPHIKNFNHKSDVNRNKYFIHMDFDAFYAQVEQRDNPKLRGKPISVGGGSGNRGIVMTASYEARAYGVEIGMSVLAARELCHDLISVPCYGPKYEAISQNILERIAELLPADCIEQYSVDECFLDITPVAKNYVEASRFAWNLKKMVLSVENLTASVGLSFNKTYAKIATKLEKPNGFTMIREEDRAKIYELPVRKMWGIGRKNEIRMHSLGIMTLGQLAEVPLNVIHKEFGVNGLVLRKFARGEDTSGISEQGERVEKSFNHNNTLSHAVYKETDAIKEIKRMSEYVCRRMRAKDLIADHIGLTVRYDDLGYRGEHLKLHHPTNSEKEIFHKAVGIYKRLPEPHVNHKIRMFGISVFELHRVSGYNLNFFDKEHLIPYKQIDYLKDKYGENIIRMGLGNS